MFIEHISLDNFKQYARLERQMPKQLVVIQGDNAQGKTTLLEAIYLAATAKLPNGAADRQLIRWGAEDDGPFPAAAVRVHVRRRDGAHLIEVVMQKGEGGRMRKEIRIDRAPRRRIDLVGQLTVVLFLPNDVDIVGGAPALRRDFLDQALSQVDAGYVQSLERYEKTLSQRNALLRQAAERRIDADELAIWDEQLAPDAVLISFARRRALSQLSRLAFPIHRELSNSAEFLQIQYEPSFDAARPNSRTRSFQYGFSTEELPSGVDQQALREAFLQDLRARRSEELSRGATLTGPHRDEFRFMNADVDIGEFGSRGQQRTAVLALKLAQVEWMTELTSEQPVLMLDEVLAELDPHRRGSLLRRISDAQQTLITTTDINRIERDIAANAAMLTVHQGVITDG